MGILIGFFGCLCPLWLVGYSTSGIGLSTFIWKTLFVRLMSPSGNKSLQFLYLLLNTSSPPTCLCAITNTLNGIIERNSYFILPFELDRPLDGCMESLHDDNIFDNSQLKTNIVHACMLTFSASSRHISLTPCSEPFELRKARRWSWQ